MCLKNDTVTHSTADDEIVREEWRKEGTRESTREGCGDGLGAKILV